jgi:cell division FtsZ-interacting protein ZapD
MSLGILKTPTEHGQLSLIVARFLHDLDLFLDLKKRCQRLLTDVSAMIDVVDRASLSLEFTKEVFSEFCRQGYLSNAQLVDFYTADAVKSRYSLLKGKLAEEESA